MTTAALTVKVKTEVQPKPILGADSAGILMTPEEFDAIQEGEYDENYRYELINGVLVVSPIPSEAEADPNEELGHLLRSYQEQHPRGRALNKTLPERYVRTTKKSTRRPDRVIWAGFDRKVRPKRDLPTIVVEFVSAGKRNWLRDYITKRDEYLTRGVREYWIINRFDQSMTVFQNFPEGVIELSVKPKKTYQTPLLPGFKLPLGRLFTVADYWEDED